MPMPEKLTRYFAGVALELELRQGWEYKAEGGDYHKEAGDDRHRLHQSKYDRKKLSKNYL